MLAVHSRVVAAVGSKHSAHTRSTLTLWLRAALLGFEAEFPSSNPITSFSLLVFSATRFSCALPRELGEIETRRVIYLANSDYEATLRVIYAAPQKCHLARILIGSLSRSRTDSFFSNPVSDLQV